MSKLPKALAAKPRTEEYDCDSVACWCSGGADCLALIREGSELLAFRLRQRPRNASLLVRSVTE